MGITYKISDRPFLCTRDRYFFLSHNHSHSFCEVELSSSLFTRDRITKKDPSRIMRPVVLQVKAWHRWQNLDHTERLLLLSWDGKRIVVQEILR